MIENNYKTILLEIQEGVGTIWLNRPEIHNAFNEVMISELIDIFPKINDSEEIIYQ